MTSPILLSAFLLVSSPTFVAKEPAVGRPVVVGDTAQASMTHQGKVVSVSANKLVTSDKDGKNEHRHMITAAAKITLGGNTVKLADLKPGDAVTVTVSPEGVVTMVEATRAV